METSAQPFEPRFTLRQLALFVAAVRTGSLTAAAAENHLSPSAVSSAVRELENALGASLLRRRAAYGVEPTPAGDAVARRAEALLRDAGELQRSVGDGFGVLSGPVAVGCYLGLASQVLPHLITTVRARHPAVELDVTDDFTRILLEPLDRGDLDVVIAYETGLGAEYHAELLFTTAPHVLLPATHRLADRRSVSLAELEGEQFLVFDQPPSGDRSIALLRGAGIDPDVRFHTPNFDLAATLVARGLGISVLLARPYTERSQEGLPLVALPLDDAPPERVVVFWPRRVGLTARARAVVDLALALGRAR